MRCNFKLYIYSLFFFFFQILGQLHRGKVYVRGILCLLTGFEPADTSIK